MSNDVKFAVIPDSHIPDHDRKAFDTALSLVQHHKPDITVILGDLLDCAPVSHWLRNKRKTLEGKRLAKDFEICNKEIDKIQALTKEIYFIEGNHEDWIRQAINENPQLDGLINLEVGLKFKERKKITKHVKYGGVVNIGKLYFTHGFYTTTYHARRHVEDFGRSIVYGHCFDDETEALTKNGWKKRLDLKVGEEVATWRDGVIEWNPIKKLWDWNQENAMVKITGRNVDLFVTNGHGMIEPDGNKWAADEWNTKAVRSFVCAAPNEFGSPLKWTDAELRLIVWIAADGNLENSSLVRFHLKKQRKIVRLKALLNELGLTFSENLQKSGTTKINVSLKDSPIRHAFDWENKRLPAELLGGTVQQGQVILNEYKHTDGSVTKTGYASVSIATYKEVEADLIQAIAVTSGVRCNKTAHGNGWVLSINPDRATSELRRENNFANLMFQGHVWCLTVDNGTVLVRRNGKVCVTQNTHDFQVHTKVSPIDVNDRHIGMSLGCLADTNPEYNQGSPNKWIHMVGLGVSRSDGSFNIDPIVITNGKASYGGKTFKG